jgi:hypothetical protein
MKQADLSEAAWFETRRYATLLTMRTIILRPSS